MDSIVLTIAEMNAALDGLDHEIRGIFWATPLLPRNIDQCRFLSQLIENGTDWQTSNAIVLAQVL